MATTAQKVVPLSAARIGRLVDKAGDLKALIGSMTAELDGILADLKENGDAEYIGNRYKVVVTTAERTSLDSKTVKTMLTPAQMLIACKTIAVTSAAVKAR